MDCANGRIMICSSYSGSEQGQTARNVKCPCTAAWSALHSLEEATTTRSFPLEPPIPPQPALLSISSCSKSQSSGLPPRRLFCTIDPPPLCIFCRSPPVLLHVLRLCIYQHISSDSRQEDPAPFTLSLYQSHHSSLSPVGFRGRKGSTVPGQ
jgi:hypothetical protein